MGSQRKLFSCGILFNFSRAGSTKCLWKEPSVVQVFAASDSVSIGGNITLITGKLKAQCTARSRDCSHWPYASGQSVVVITPENPEVSDIGD